MSGGASRNKKLSAKRTQPPLLHASDEMRRICAAFGEEIESLPGVTTRPMFGFVGYYRNGVIFAALPKTRALLSPNTFIFKLHMAPGRVAERAARDARITAPKEEKAGWLYFEVGSECDIADAQRWLLEAWRHAVKVKGKK